MVSSRCITVVKDALENLGFQDIKVNLGEVSLKEKIPDAQVSQIRSILLRSGFELLEDKKNILLQQIKTHIIQLVYYSDEPLVQNLSVYLSDKLHHDYTYMSNLCWQIHGLRRVHSA